LFRANYYPNCYEVIFTWFQADVAIAAPFDNDSEGAVYIYHGKASFGVNKGTPVLPALKLTPSALQLTLKGFGSSLFGGVDIDGSSTTG